MKKQLVSILCVAMLAIGSGISAATPEEMSAQARSKGFKLCLKAAAKMVAAAVCAGNALISVEACIDNEQRGGRNTLQFMLPIYIGVPASATSAWLLFKSSRKDSHEAKALIAQARELSAKA